MVNIKENITNKKMVKKIKIKTKKYKQNEMKLKLAKIKN